MNIEKILDFFFKHNALLIESITAIILLIAAYLAIRNFKEKNEDEHPAAAANPAAVDMTNIENMLKQIIERANQAQASATVPTASNGGTGDEKLTATLIADITALKTELVKKQSEIESLKSAAGATAQAPGLSAQEKATLEAQISDLKNKLEEFDIISQDIADLAFYKEENQRLQKELAARGVSVDPAKPAPNPQTPVPTLSDNSEPIVAPTNNPPPTEPPKVEVAAKEPVSEPVPTPSPTPPPVATIEAKPENLQPTPTQAPEHAVENIIDDDIMKDFAMAVAEQKNTSELAVKVSASPPKPEEKTVVSGAVPDQGSSQTVSGDKNPFAGMDLDKMVNELNTLPAVENAPEVNALEQSLDPDKLAQEASSMDPKAEEKALMDEFENFVKKEKT